MHECAEFICELWMLLCYAAFCLNYRRLKTYTNGSFTVIIILSGNILNRDILPYIRGMYIIMVFGILRVAKLVSVESIIFQFDFQGNESDRMYNRRGLKTGLFVLMVFRAKIAIEADRHALVDYHQGYISKPIYITYTSL